MTTARAQRLARKYGKDRFGPRVDEILKTGVRFKELEESQAIKDWECHVKNLPDNRGRVNSCAYTKTQRRMLRQKDLVVA
jgi:hypothetical protein